jgi:hypothetical protein
MSGLRRAALVFGIVALLLFADGVYLVAAHKNPNGDTGVLFGNSNYYLNAGTVVVLSALLVFTASAIMWLVDVHRKDKERARRSAEARLAREQPEPSGGTVPRASAEARLAREQPEPPGGTVPRASVGDPPTRDQPGPSGRTATQA